ncbi:MAG: cytochrome c-type biogenesis protein CcmH, partial [Anaerolineae bacterium]
AAILAVAGADRQAKAQTAEAGTVGGAPADDVAALARELNCPLCQGYNLQDCPLLVCAQMREVIGEKLAAGESEEDIVAFFVAQYGPQVLNEPPRRGFHLLAWTMPVVGLVLAGALAAVFLSRSRARHGSQGGPGPAPEAASEEYLGRLEELLGREDG